MRQPLPSIRTCRLGALPPVEPQGLLPTLEICTQNGTMPAKFSQTSCQRSAGRVTKLKLFLFFVRHNYCSNQLSCPEFKQLKFERLFELIRRPSRALNQSQAEVSGTVSWQDSIETDTKVDCVFVQKPSIFF